MPCILVVRLKDVRVCFFMNAFINLGNSNLANYGNDQR